MAKQKNSFIVVTDPANGLIYEAWTASEKTALQQGRFREWARSPSHQGLRRILRPGTPWPQVIEEANYLTAAREPRLDRPAVSAIEDERLAQQRAEHKAREEAAFVARTATLHAKKKIRHERLAALDARLGRHRPIFDLPSQDPDTLEWI